MECCNAFGFGACHLFMLISAPLCILLAIGGQFYGCSPTLRASGFGESYTCNENEEQLYFFNNMWQCTIWTVYVLQILQKPSKQLVALLFTPFMLLSVALAVYSTFHPPPTSTPAATAISMILSSVVWFALFGYCYYVHVEPRSPPLFQG